MSSVCQSQSLMTPSQPHVMTFDVSCGNHRQLIQTESWALNRVNIRVVLHSQTVSFPSASPEITKLFRRRREGKERVYNREVSKIMLVTFI